MHLKSRIGELENRAPSQYEGPVNTVHIEVRKENQASADNNDDSSNTCPCYNAPQLVESTSTMPPTTCQNQQQISNTDRSHLNDGDLIPQSTDCDTNQQSYDHALCANALQLPIPTRITNRVSSQQQKRKLRGKFRKEFNHNYNQVFRKRLPSPRTFRQPNYPRHYPRPTQTKDPSTFSNLVVSNNRRVDKDNQLILNSDNSPADLLQSHNNNLINGAKSRDGQHMKGNSNARKLPNITELKSLFQVLGVSATMNEVDNKVDTYPIIDGHHCSLRNVSSVSTNP